MRALRYWDKLDVISLTFAGTNDSLSNVTINDLSGYDINGMGGRGINSAVWLLTHYLIRLCLQAAMQHR